MITSTGVGGAERLLANLVLHLPRDRVEPDIVSLKPLGEIGREMIEHGVAVRSLGIPDGVRGAWPTLRAILAVRRHLRERRPDLVHSLLFRANLVARLAAAGPAPIPVIAFLGGHQARWKNRLERLTRRRVRRYVAVARSLVATYADRAGLATESIDVIHPGVAIPGPVDAAAVAAARALWDRDDPKVLRVLWLGRFVAAKGVSSLLAAFERVVARDERPQLLLQGFGPGLRRAKGEIAHRRLASRVRIREATDRVPALLAAAHVVVLASLREGLPNVILEALAAGRFVVATRVDGVPEVIEDDATGRLVPAQDPAALAEALLWVADHPEEREAMARAGRARVREHFGLDAMVARYLKLYETVRAEVRHPLK